MEELKKLAGDEAYLRQVLGCIKVKWALIGSHSHFGVRSIAAKSRWFTERYNSVLERAARAPRVSGLFAAAIERVLRSMPDRTATAHQVCGVLEATPAFMMQLHPAHFMVARGKKTPPR